MAEEKKKKTKHESGPFTKKEVKDAGGSLKEAYRRRAEAGDQGAIETMKRVGRSDLEARRKRASKKGVIPSYFEHRNKLLNQQ